MNLYSKNWSFKERSSSWSPSKVPYRTRSKAIKPWRKLFGKLRNCRTWTKQKTLSIQFKDKRKQLTEEVSQINEELYTVNPTEVSSNQAPLEVGDYVKLRTGGSTGTIESINKNKAIIQIGDLRMTAKLRDLIRAKAPLKIQKRESVSTDMVQYTAKFDSKIDIRGLRMEEAIKMVENFVDKALISNSPNLRIIHGKGNGILRKAVRRKLKEYNVKMELSHPNHDDGGDGVTIVEIL